MIIRQIVRIKYISLQALRKRGRSLLRHVSRVRKKMIELYIYREKFCYDTCRGGRAPRDHGGGCAPRGCGGGREVLSAAVDTLSAPRLAMEVVRLTMEDVRDGGHEPSRMQLAVKVACLAIGLHRSLLSSHGRRDCAPIA